MLNTSPEFMKQHPELPVYHGKRNRDIENFAVPRPHHNQTVEKQEFCKIHSGKTFSELGISVIPLTEFEFEDLE